MNQFLIFIFGTFLFLFVYFLFRKEKFKFQLSRGVDLVLFSVLLPQEIKKEEKFNLKEYLKIAQDFFSSLTILKEKNPIKRLFLGNPYLVIEIAVPRIGEEISYYFACPRKFSEILQKQILGFWQNAQIQKAQDYNIFHPEGFAVGAFAKLTKNPIFPLKFFDEFESPPMALITSVFTKLKKEGEGACFQILLRPTQKPPISKSKKLIKLLQEGKEISSALREVTAGVFEDFEKKIKEAFLPSTQKSQQTQLLSQKPPELPPYQREIIQGLSRKMSLPIFDVNLRLLSSAETKERAEAILKELESAFSQFNSPLLNSLRFVHPKGGKLQQLFYEYSFRIFNQSQSIQLSSGELGTIFHFPPPVVLTPYVKWLKAKQVPAPPNLPKEGLILGKNVFRGEERTIPILEDDRRRHIYILGQTGTGKSSLLQEMIRQDIENGKGVCLIDPHGDLAERVLGLVPPSRIEDVVYVNPGDTERPVGINMLEYDPAYPEAKTFVVNELLEIFEKLYNLKVHGFGGPIYEQYMRNALLLVMEDPTSGNTLLEVPRVLSDSSFRRLKLSRCKNLVVKNFWELEAEKAGGELALANLVPYITSKMNVFIANDLARPILCQQTSTINFREIMDTGKILIVNLAKGKLGDLNSYLLGMIIVGKLLLAAFSRIEIPEEKRRDFFVYIDEFHNVTTKTIGTALAEARKFRLNLTLAHQYIGQLDEETRKAIFGNIGTMLTFRVGPEDAKFLVTQYEQVFLESDFVGFDNFTGAIKLLIRGVTSKPFTFVTLPPKPPNPEIAKLAKEYSRMKYGRERALVEEEISQRLKY